MRSFGWVSVVGMVALIGCGDDAAPAEPCPMTLMAGATQACMCDDTMVGAQTCGTDGLLTPCMCGPGAPTLTGGTGATATGGGGGEGGTSNMTGTTGGSGGTMALPMDEDAGTSMGGTGGAGADGGMAGTGAAVPMDGTQNALCEGGIDCNKGLDCYLPTGVGAGYCTIPCMGDMQCKGIAGADYTCSPEGLCRVVCDGADDTMSCPEGMACVPGNFGPGPGTGRCNWPEGGMMAGTTHAYGECMTSAACEDGLQCALPATSPFPGTGGPGYCTKTCMNNTDCPEAPATSDIPATCEPGQFGSMMGICALDCFGSPMGCPDGMTCQSSAGGLFRRCAY